MQQWFQKPRENVSKPELCTQSSQALTFHN